MDLIQKLKEGKSLEEMVLETMAEKTKLQEDLETKESEAAVLMLYYKEKYKTKVAVKEAAKEDSGCLSEAANE